MGTHQGVIIDSTALRIGNNARCAYKHFFSAVEVLTSGLMEDLFEGHWTMTSYFFEKSTKGCRVIKA